MFDESNTRVQTLNEAKTQRKHTVRHTHANSEDGKMTSITRTARIPKLETSDDAADENAKKDTGKVTVVEEQYINGVDGKRDKMFRYNSQVSDIS